MPIQQRSLHDKNKKEKKKKKKKKRNKKNTTTGLYSSHSLSPRKKNSYATQYSPAFRNNSCTSFI